MTDHGTKMNDKLTEIFALTLNVPPESISNNTSPENTEGWDSVANLLLISAIEETFDVELTTAEIETMKDVGRVRTVLNKRLVNSA